MSEKAKTPKTVDNDVRKRELKRLSFEEAEERIIRFVEELQRCRGEETLKQYVELAKGMKKEHENRTSIPMRLW